MMWKITNFTQQKLDKQHGRPEKWVVGDSAKKILNYSEYPGCFNKSYRKFSMLKTEAPSD